MTRPSNQGEIYNNNKVTMPHPALYSIHAGTCCMAGAGSAGARIRPCTTGWRGELPFMSAAG